MEVSITINNRIRMIPFVIKFSGFKEDFSHDNSALLHYLQTNLQNLVLNNNLNIFNNDSFNISSKEFKNSINLCITPENIDYVKVIYYPHTRFYRFNLYLKKSFYLDFSELFSRFIYFINKQFKKHKIPNRPSLKNFVYKMCTNNSNNFAIVTNNFKSENILNFPYFFHIYLNNFQEFIDIKKKSKYRKKKKFCAFIATNHNCKDRIEFFHKLSRYKKIDSFGKVLNNSTIAEELIKKYKYINYNDSQYNYNINLVNQELFRDYKFVICFENSYSDDYITEKLPNVMMANSIGIYRGAKNINEFFNTKSFINYDDYCDYDQMIDKIIELDKNEESYRKILDEPFFINNELPPRIKTAKTDLRNFILKIVKIKNIS